MRSFEEALLEAKTQGKPMLIYYDHPDVPQARSYREHVFPTPDFIALSEKFVCVINPKWPWYCLFPTHGRPSFVFADAQFNIYLDIAGDAKGTWVGDGARWEQRQFRNMSLRPRESREDMTWSIRMVTDVAVRILHVRSGLAEHEVRSEFGRPPDREVWLDPADSVLKVRFAKKRREGRRFVGWDWTQWYMVPRTAMTGVQVYAICGYGYKRFNVKSKVWIYLLSSQCKVVYVYFDKSGHVGYVYVGGG